MQEFISLTERVVGSADPAVSSRNDDSAEEAEERRCTDAGLRATHLDGSRSSCDQTPAVETGRRYDDNALVDGVGIPTFGRHGLRGSATVLRSRCDSASVLAARKLVLAFLSRSRVAAGSSWMGEVVVGAGTSCSDADGSSNSSGPSIPTTNSTSPDAGRRTSRRSDPTKVASG